PAIDDGQSVEVTAVLGEQGGDERGPPARHETVRGIQRTQAREAGVDEPQLWSRPGQLVYADVTGHVSGRGQKTGVVLAGRLQPPGGVGLVVERLDRVGGADGQPAVIDGQAHRRAEGAEVSVERPADFGPQDYELAGLISRDEYAGTQLRQQRR